MRSVFGALFLLLAAVLVLLTSQLYLKSLSDKDAYCSSAIETGPAVLVFFLTSGAIALSHLPWRDKVFRTLKRIKRIWGISFFLFALVLLCVQFRTFRDHSCEDDIGLIPKLLITTLTAACFILALLWVEGRALGTAFLLISMATISALAFSLTSKGLELSTYGYFAQVVNTILLTALGAIEIGPNSTIAAIRDRFSEEAAGPFSDDSTPPQTSRDP